MKVFAGKVPFSDEGVPAATIHIVEGIHPGRPNHPDFAESLWTLTERCWSGEARDRLEMGEVVKVLGELSAFAPRFCGESYRSRRGHRGADEVVLTSSTPLGESPVGRPSPPATAISRRPTVRSMHSPPPVGMDRQETPPPEIAAETEQEVLRTPEKKHGLWCRIRLFSSSLFSYS